MEWKNLIIVILSLTLLNACQGVKEASQIGGTFFVDRQAKNASDANPGTAEKPWKTLNRAGSAPELRPGDTVFIKAGVYREEFIIKVAGTRSQPITFQAVPSEKVLVKGSKLLRTSKWIEVQREPKPKIGGYPKIWKTRLSNEFFADPYFKDPQNRLVNLVVQDDRTLFQMIGLDPIHDKPRNFAKMLEKQAVGKTPSDMLANSFYFDQPKQELYVTCADPSWYQWEIGVLRGVLKIFSKSRDVILRGIEFRHDRAIGFGNLGSVNGERILIEDSTFNYSSFNGFMFGRNAKNCVLRNCDLSYNGCTGAGMHKAESCVIDGCSIMFNNWRSFNTGWHAGGVKAIPSNKRCIIKNCEVAYNYGFGVWFDGCVKRERANLDCAVLDNVIHHNTKTGVSWEANLGGLIAGNFCYYNGHRGIYSSHRSCDMEVFHNTCVANAMEGICLMGGKAKGEPEKYDNQVLNNLLIGNRSGITLKMGKGPLFKGNQCDFNYYSDSYAAHPLLVRPGYTQLWPLAKWRETFDLGIHSRLGPATYKSLGSGIKLSSPGSLKKRLNFAKQVKVEYDWHPKNPATVGCGIYQWNQNTPD